MGFFKFFRNRGDDASAKVAKDRLQVLIAHERTNRNAPDYLPMLKRDLLNVIKKYVSVGDDQVSVQLDTQDEFDILELNITLPDDSADAAGKPTVGVKSRSSKVETST